MSITEKIAISFGKKAREALNIDNDGEEVIIYGAINILQTVFSILCIAIAGALLGVLYEALLFSIFSAILRKRSGGVHASSSGRCIIMGTIIAIAGGFIVKNIYLLNSVFLVILDLFCMLYTIIMVIKYAPVDSVNKPIDNESMRQKFKKQSIFVTAIFSVLLILFIAAGKEYNIIFLRKGAECIALGSLWQAFTLTKAGSIAFNKGDFVIKYIMERKLL